jgi:hypothetical protein
LLHFGAFSSILLAPIELFAFCAFAQVNSLDLWLSDLLPQTASRPTQDGRASSSTILFDGIFSSTSGMDSSAPTMI